MTSQLLSGASNERVRSIKTQETNSFFSPLFQNTKRVIQATASTASRKIHDFAHTCSNLSRRPGFFMRRKIKFFSGAESSLSRNALNNFLKVIYRALLKEKEDFIFFQKIEHAKTNNEAIKLLVDFLVFRGVDPSKIEHSFLELGIEIPSMAYLDRGVLSLLPFGKSLLGSVTAHLRAIKREGFLNGSLNWFFRNGSTILAVASSVHFMSAIIPQVAAQVHIPSFWGEEKFAVTEPSSFTSETQGQCPVCDVQGVDLATCHQLTFSTYSDIMALYCDKPFEKYLVPCGLQKVYELCDRTLSPKPTFGPSCTCSIFDRMTQDLSIPHNLPPSCVISPDLVQGCTVRGMHGDHKLEIACPSQFFGENYPKFRHYPNVRYRNTLNFVPCERKLPLERCNNQFFPILKECFPDNMLCPPCDTLHNVVTRAEFQGHLGFEL